MKHTSRFQKFHLSKGLIAGEKLPIRNIRHSRDIVELISHIPEWDDREYRESFYVIALSQRNFYLSHFLAGSGGTASVLVDTRLCFTFLCSVPACTGFVVAHNHPSGGIQPSDADKAITRRLSEGGKLMDFQMLDHVILTNENNRYFSFADEGLL